MKLTIEVDLDSEAFADGGTDELKSTLANVAESLRGLWATAHPTQMPAIDSNGNTVGTATIT